MKRIFVLFVIGIIINCFFFSAYTITKASSIEFSSTSSTTLKNSSTDISSISSITSNSSSTESSSNSSTSWNNNSAQSSSSNNLSKIALSSSMNLSEDPIISDLQKKKTENEKIIRIYGMAIIFLLIMIGVLFAIIIIIVIRNMKKKKILVDRIYRTYNSSSTPNDEIGSTGNHNSANGMNDKNMLSNKDNVSNLFSNNNPTINRRLGEVNNTKNSYNNQGSPSFLHEPMVEAKFSSSYINTIPIITRDVGLNSMERENIGIEKTLNRHLQNDKVAMSGTIDENNDFSKSKNDNIKEFIDELNLKYNSRSRIFSEEKYIKYADVKPYLGVQRREIVFQTTSDEDAYFMIYMDRYVFLNYKIYCEDKFVITNSLLDVGIQFAYEFVSSGRTIDYKDVAKTNRIKKVALLTKLIETNPGTYKVEQKGIMEL